MEYKIKQYGINIGSNIKRIRKEKDIKQIELLCQLHLMGVDMTRERLSKIERGVQHITSSQLRAIRDCLETTYDELLKETEE